MCEVVVRSRFKFALSFERGIGFPPSYAEGGWFNPASTYKVPTGEAVMATFGYQRYTIGYCGGCLIVYIIVCRVISYLALRFIKA